jgi:hypothetical protein
MKIPASIVPLTLVGSLALAVLTHANADAPAVTLTTGMGRGGGWSCSLYHPEMPEGHSIQVSAGSDGAVLVSGSCTSAATVEIAFTANRVQWQVDPNWNWDSCGRCSSSQWADWGPSQPRLACATPFYTEFTPPFLAWNIEDASFTAEAKTSWGYTNWWGSQSDQESRSRSGEMRFTFCRDDLDASGSIDGGDLGMLLAWWGANEVDGTLYFCSRMDFDDSGAIDGADLGILLAHWGECAIPN